MFRSITRVTTVAILSTWAAGFAAAAEPAVSHQGAVTPEAVQTLPPWGSSAHVVAADGFYFAGQPDAAGFAQAAAAGVTTVINLRRPDEVEWDVGAAVRQAGMAYFNEPLLMGRDGIDAASVARISQLVADKPDGQVLIHCASGNRVAVWWALHLAAQHGMASQQAVAMAQQAGMKPALAPLVERHLQQ